MSWKQQRYSVQRTQQRYSVQLTQQRYSVQRTPWDIQKGIQFLNQPNYLPREQLNCEFLLAYLNNVIAMHRQFMAKENLRPPQSLQQRVLVMTPSGPVEVTQVSTVQGTAYYNGQ